MNQAFFDALTGHLAAITQDLRFYHNPTGTTKAPQIIQTQIARPTTPPPDSDEYPFVQIVAHEGTFSRGKNGRVQVRVDCGIYNPTEVMADGDAAIFSLLTTIGNGLISKPWVCRPYKLCDPVSFSVGVPAGFSIDINNIGQQPHPHYFCSLTLEFITDTSRTI